MIRHDASYPDTPRAVDWRDQAACRGHQQPDLWFASSKRHLEAADAAEAKRICGLCPVRRDCLAFALDQGIVEGIYGGFDEDDRKGLRRRVTKGTTTITDAAKATPPEKKPSTLRAYFDANTTRIFGGHLEWTGPAKPAFRGRDYTPRRIAFVIDRGYEPTGQVLTDCGHKGCVLPAHLTDADERKAPKSEAAEEIRLPRWNREPEPCGTREAYQRHRRRGETPCEPCRAANSAADRRLRETGTTRVLVR